MLYRTLRTIALSLILLATGVFVTAPARADCIKDALDTIKCPGTSGGPATWQDGLDNILDYIKTNCTPAATNDQIVAALCTYLRNCGIHADCRELAAWIHMHAADWAIPPTPAQRQALLDCSGCTPACGSDGASPPCPDGMENVNATNFCDALQTMIGNLLACLRSKGITDDDATREALKNAVCKFFQSKDEGGCWYPKQPDTTDNLQPCMDEVLKCILTLFGGSDIVNGQFICDLTNCMTAEKKKDCFNILDDCSNGSSGCRPCFTGPNSTAMCNLVAAFDGDLCMRIRFVAELAKARFNCGGCSSLSDTEKQAAILAAICDYLTHCASGELAGKFCTDIMKCVMNIPELFDGCADFCTFLACIKPSGCPEVCDAMSTSSEAPVPTCPQNYDDLYAMLQVARCCSGASELSASQWKDIICRWAAQWRTNSACPKLTCADIAQAIYDVFYCKDGTGSFADTLIAAIEASSSTCFDCTGGWPRNLQKTTSCKRRLCHGSSKPADRGANTGTMQCNNVDLAYGYKLEFEADLSVALPGGDFVLTRAYSSAGHGAKGAAGYGWTFSSMQNLVEDTTTPDTLYIDGPDADDRYRYVRPTATPPGAFWYADKPMQEYITKETSVTWNGSAVYVWRVHSPGAGYSEFLTKDTPNFVKGAGLLVRQVNAYGRVDEYSYDLTKYRPQLTEIALGVVSGTPKARVLFAWNLSGSARNTISKVTAARLSGSVWVITDTVEYTYLEPGTGGNQFANPSLGLQGDLVQVLRREMTDSSAGGSPVFRERFTQYRYHDGSTPTGSSGDIRQYPLGAAHQLKLVINPEQVEYFADVTNRRGYGPFITPALAHRAGATTLLKLSDMSGAFVESSATRLVVDLASKFINYQSAAAGALVAEEYLQSSCGCSGGGQGIKMAFAYDTGTNSGETYRRATVSEYEQSGTGTYSTSEFRVTRYEMKELNGTPFLIAKALGTSVPSFSSSTPNGWVWAYAYNEGTGGNGPLTLRAEFMPSAITAFAPSTGTGGSYSPATFSVSSSVGLVTAYDYTTTDHRLTETWVGSGSVTSMPPGSGFKVLEKIEYGSYDASLRPNERDYLPKSIKRCRTGSTSDLTTANDNEEVTFAYTFHTSAGDNIASVKRTAERELTGENGPGGTVDSWELYDTSGQNVHSRDEVLAVTTRTFDGTTGRLASVERNDATAPTGSSFGGITTTGWGGLAGGELTTTYTRDLMGRITAVTSPGLGSGITTYTAREMRDDLTDTGKATGSPSISSRGVTTYAETALPHKLTSSGPYNGPATVQWENAGGSTLCSMDFEVTYTPGSYLGYTLGTTLANSVKQLAYTGVTKGTQAWSKVSGSADVTTSYDYDQRGRVSVVVQPSLTRIEYTYGDISDRVLIVKVGDGSSTPAKVADYAYDSTSFSSTAAQEGFGDGNLRVARQYTATSTTRDTTHYYDERDRKYLTTGPVTPYDAVSYDNLNRVTYRGLLKAAPSSITPANVDSALSTTTNTDRGLLTATSYSQRGMVYKSETAVDPAALGSGYLASNSFFDAAGRTIAAVRPAAPAVKRVLDGHGRVTTSYVTDRKGDDGASSGDRFSEWTSITASSSGSADNVLEQTETTYSATTGMPDLVTTIQRWHASTTTGALSYTTGIATYVGYRYDEANRLTHTVNFGTNRSDNIFGMSGAAPSWPLGSNAVPTYSTSGYADTIITETKYNTRGLVSESVDGEGRRAATFYDDLSRPYATVENYNAASGFSITWSSTYQRWSVTYPSGNAADVNRTTTTVYDSSGRAVKLVAHAPGTSGETVQETAYDYGVTTSSTLPSSLATKDLLAAVRYPSRVTSNNGAASDLSGEPTGVVLYGYNHAGELVSVKDQSTTQHDYTRDTAGRVTLDSVSNFGANIDQAVKSISVTYDDFGRLGRVRSHSVASPSSYTSSVVNAAEYGYTPLWQVRDVYQCNSGDVTLSGTTPTGNTLTTKYEYATVENGSGSSPRNYSRQLKMYYPTQSYTIMDYGTSSTDIANLISRPKGIREPVTSISTTTIVGYGYIGLGTFSSASYSQVGVQLDRTLSHDGKRYYGTSLYTTQTAGDYPCLDRFGRVIRQVWADTGLTTHATSTVVPNLPPLVELAHTYDKNSNRLTRTDARPGARLASRDWEYQYDGLDRLKQADKGHRGSSSFVLDRGTQAWVLDALGNWASFKEDLSGNGAFETAEIEARTHNAVNELTQRTPGGGSGLPLQYDDAGNMKWNAAFGSSGYTLVHDGWNRLVRVEVQSSYNPGTGGYTVLKNAYNGLHWRVKSDEDAQQAPNGTLQKSAYWYDASWRVLEEHVDRDADGTPESIYSEFWGLRYIDDAVLRREYDWVSAEIMQWYHLTDAQFSTIALVDPSGVIRERISYDPYGRARHRWGMDVDGNAKVNAADGTRVTAVVATVTGGPTIDDATNYDVDCDVDRSGRVDASDDSIVNDTTQWVTELPAGWISDGGLDAYPYNPNAAYGPRNPFGYCGYMHNPNAELYTVRFRHYSPTLGRWVERDPAGYVDGMSLFEYAGGQATQLVDPLGLCACANPPRAPVERYPDSHQINENQRQLIMDFDYNCYTSPWGTKNVDTWQEALAKAKKYLKDSKTRCRCVTVAGHGLSGVFKPGPSGGREDRLIITATEIANLEKVLDSENLCKLLERTDPNRLKEMRALRELLDLLADTLGDGGRLEIVACKSGEGQGGKDLGEALARRLRGVRILLFEENVYFAPGTVFGPTCVNGTKGKSWLLRFRNNIARPTEYYCPKPETPEPSRRLRHLQRHPRPKHLQCPIQNHHAVLHIGGIPVNS